MSPRRSKPLPTSDPAVPTTPLQPRVRFRLLPGARVELHGRVLRVTGFTGDGSPEQPVQVTLVDDQQVPVVLPLLTLVGHDSFRCVDPEATPEPTLAPYHAHWEALKPEIKDAALKREAHMQELLTGFRSGRADQAEMGEPRPAYLQTQSMGDRVAAKAAELGKSTRQVNRWLSQYRNLGHHPYALVDRNGLRLSQRLGSQEVGLADAILSVAKRRQDATDVSFVELRGQVQDHLDELHRSGKLTKPVPMPSQPTFNKLVKTLAPELARHARQRQSEKSRDQGRRFHTLVSTRPGQYVLIDVTPVDLLARSEVDGRELRLRLILALDHYSRAVVAAEFLEYEPNGVDISTILLDIIFPTRAHPSWPALPADAHLPYAGVPEAVLLAAHHMPEGSPLINVPPVLPDAVVVDNGKVFLSRELFDLCARLEIDVLYARPATGSDKAHIERAFRTLRQGVAERLRGYVGPHLLARGKHPVAFHFAWELRFEITQWIARVYNHATHVGLSHPAMPKIKLSPSQMYAHGVSHAGQLTIPIGKDAYFLALRTELRKITDVGVRIDGFQYDDDVLNSYRNTESPYLEFDRRWAFKVDRRDPAQIYWQDPHTDEWHALPSRQADWRARPFQDVLADSVRVVFSERDFANTNDVDMQQVKRELRQDYAARVKATEQQTRRAAGQKYTRAEHGQVARETQAQTKKNRGKAAPPQAPAHPPVVANTPKVRRSPEWDRPLSLPGDEEMEVVGNEF